MVEVGQVKDGEKLARHRSDAQAFALLVIRNIGAVSGIVGFDGLTDIRLVGLRDDAPKDFERFGVVEMFLDLFQENGVVDGVKILTDVELQSIDFLVRFALGELAEVVFDQFMRICLAK